MAALVGRASIGDEHPRWTGDSATVMALHRRVHGKKERTGICEHCGREGRTDFANIRNHEYTDDPDDYIELCRPCHQRF
jgi:hypothetical protein